jgi:hypothetical protein
MLSQLFISELCEVVSLNKSERRKRKQAGERGGGRREKEKIF